MIFTPNEIEIVKANSTKINTVDFENISFGNVFTDYMFVCDYKEGSWKKTIIS